MKPPRQDSAQSPVQKDEFDRFTRLLDKLLKVPSAKIKAELEAERTGRRTKTRASVGHAYRDND